MNSKEKHIMGVCKNPAPIRLVFHDPPWAIFSFHSKNDKRKKTITLAICYCNDLYPDSWNPKFLKTTHRIHEQQQNDKENDNFWHQKWSVWDTAFFFLVLSLSSPFPFSCLFLYSSFLFSFPFPVLFPFLFRFLFCSFSFRFPFLFLSLSLSCPFPFPFLFLSLSFSSPFPFPFFTIPFPFPFPRSCEFFHQGVKPALGKTMRKKTITSGKKTFERARDFYKPRMKIKEKQMKTNENPGKIMKKHWTPKQSYRNMSEWCKKPKKSLNNKWKPTNKTRKPKKNTRKTNENQ